MALTIVALLLFLAMVVAWILLPGSAAVTQAAPETETAAQAPVQTTA